MPKKAKLPMRFLVLGKLTNKNESLLSERPMHSLLPGMKVDSFMQEMKVASPIEPKGLAVKLSGHLEGTITGAFKKPPESGDRTATIKLTGTAEVSGKGKDNGLGDFEGTVMLEGEHEFTLENRKLKLPRGGEEVQLQVTGIVEPPGDGDFEAGITGSIDVPIAVKITENTLSDEDLELDLKSPVESHVPVSLTIPLRGISDFRPDNLAERVPEIRRLVLLRRLVLELRSYISSNPQLGVAIRAQLEATNKELSQARKNAHVDVATADKDLEAAKQALDEAQKARDAAEDATKAKAQKELDRVQEKYQEAVAKRAQAERNEALTAKVKEVEDGPEKELDAAQTQLKAADKAYSDAAKARDEAQGKRDAAKQALDQKQQALDAAEKKVDEAEAAGDDAAQAAAEGERDTAKQERDDATTAFTTEENALSQAQDALDNAGTALDDAQDEVDQAKRELAKAQAECDALARLSTLTTLAQLKGDLAEQFPLLMVEPPAPTAKAIA